MCISLPAPARHLARFTGCPVASLAKGDAGKLGLGRAAAVWISGVPLPPPRPRGGVCDPDGSPVAAFTLLTPKAKRVYVLQFLTWHLSVPPPPAPLPGLHPTPPEGWAPQKSQHTCTCSHVTSWAQRRGGPAALPLLLSPSVQAHLRPVRPHSWAVSTMTAASGTAGWEAGVERWPPNPTQEGRHL